MNTSNPLPPITVSSFDLDRLEQLIDSPALRQLPAAQALGQELARASVLPPAQMPADVVTMNSTVTCRDGNTGERHRLTLVFPRDADVATHRISVLAPVGAALLGLRIGQQIDWPAPDGRMLHLEVEAIHYQPEAAGDLHR